MPVNDVKKKNGKELEGYTNGKRHFINPNFYKCFFKDCIVPEPAPPIEEPKMEKCPLAHCPNSNLNEYKELHIPETIHAVVDEEAMSRANYHFKWTSVFLSGTMEIKTTDLKDGDTLTIEVDHIILNTRAKSEQELSRRKRRDIRNYDNGGLIIGTAENPVPCGAKVIIKIGGDIHARSFGALPDSIPLGAKAIGGLGSIRMHGCTPKNTWTTVKTNVAAGENTFTVTGDVSDWKAGDRIFVATSDFIKEHTEEFDIKSISGNTITIDGTFKYRHLGDDDTAETLLGRHYSQAAEVGLLSRNIVLDGRAGSTEDDFGARIVMTKTTEVIGHHTYVRSGVGQFDGVEFQGFGQKGADRYSDYRCQILFYDLVGGESQDENREQSYVKNCAFNRGYHTAVATLENSDGILIENNVVLGTVNDGIKSDSAGTIIKNNLVAACEHILLYKDYFATTKNANFNVDVVPSGIWHTEGVILEGNHVVGVSGNCYSGMGEVCDEATEACNEHSNDSQWKDNVGHACWNGYYLYRRGHWCTKIAKFNFYKMNHFGVLVYTHIKTAIIDSVIVADSKVGVQALLTGPSAVGHAVGDKTVTIKNSVVIGNGDKTYDCATDSFNGYHGQKYNGKLHPPIESTDQVALMIPEFPDTKTGFPQSGQWDTDLDVTIEARTCVFNTAISNYANKCKDIKSIVVSSQRSTLDHVFQMTFEKGNSCTNCDPTNLIRVYRPSDKDVNPADCGDMHCDGLKRTMIVDKDGALFDGVPGTYLGETEFEWNGQTRGGKTYTSTADGLTDKRIPAPIRFTMDGKLIKFSDIYKEAGTVRSPECQYKKNYHGWFCPFSSGLEYYDLVYEMMDLDHMTRKLTPLAVRSEDGYLDLINGPADHTCCIGYACNMRLMTLHSTVACGKTYDYMMSSTLPIEQRIHFKYAPPECKIRMVLYTKRPNRIKVFVGDGKNAEERLPANTVFNAATGKLDWAKPDKGFIPDIGLSKAGAHYQERKEQVLHVIVQGGEMLTLKIAQTLVLELSVMTELTEDEFYDNGNLAKNLAALLGIDPSRIRIMNVINESQSARRRRHADHGFELTEGANYRLRREEDQHTALQFEVQPEVL